MSNSKFYFSRLRIRDGEREYYSPFTIEAKDLDDAIKKADDYSKDFWSNGFKEDEDDSGYFHCDGETYTRVDSIQEINEDEFKVLRRLLL